MTGWGRMALAVLAALCAHAACADGNGSVPGRTFDVSPREIFRDNSAMKPQRSGHMGHALIDCGGGRILDFCSNCDGFRAEGHSGYGWMEYCVSTNWGRTFGPPRVLGYSKRLYEEGQHTALCEKGVCLADGRVVLFFQITDQSKPICCEPWSASTMIVSEDGGETWGEPRPTGAKPGRIYDALVRGNEVLFLLQENEHFLGKGPQHVYRLYRAGPDLAFTGVTLPFDAKGKGYGAMEFAADGALQAYVYDSQAESEMCCTVSRDGGRTWGPVRRCHMDKLIRNPQIRRLDDLWFCTGRNGGGPESDGIVLYASADGLHWTPGEKIDERPKGEGTGYYSCLLPVREPGAAPRMLLQYSHVYKAKRVNIAHRWITPRRKSAAEVELKTECEKPGGWTFSVSESGDGERAVYTISLKAERPEPPPVFDAWFSCAPRGAHSVWVPMCESSERHRLYAVEWGGVRYTSELAQNEPIACAFGEDERNSLTIACSEAMRRVKYAITCRSTDARLEGRFRFFTKGEAPRTDYEVKILVDRRRVFWADAVREGSAWIAASAGLAPCRVPEAAFDPLYSSWYAFWQDVHDDEIVREAAAAAKLGLRSMILDDGWQKEKSRTYYSATGDWMPVKNRFPDMRRHVDRVHAAGIRNYLLWLSVPFVGDESQAYARFRGKFVWGDGGDTACLDPRFPEVREYLLATYERCVRDWDFDGLKLDFIDSIATDDDPAAKDGYAGRDCKTLPEGIDRLMRAAHDRLAAIKPDVLIEFRQRYTGPAIRRYGNMLRATDCPYDILGNRKRIADLRLTSAGTAVHADMLVWSPEDTPADAARVILDALFGVVQYSMRLATVSEAHRRVIRHWIDFTQRHRDTLLKGAFRPHHPELMYPVIEAEGAEERIVAVYADGQLVRIGPDKPVVVVNASAAADLVLELAVARSARIFDTEGRLVREISLPSGLTHLPCPASGYAVLVVPGRAKPPCDP